MPSIRSSKACFTFALKCASELQLASVGVSPVIEQEIFNLLEGQTLSQLTDLRKSVERKLYSDEAIDVEYWQCLLKNLDVAVAKVLPLR